SVIVFIGGSFLQGAKLGRICNGAKGQA
ncbi:MAG: hypothetical protein FD150_1775, partial [Rhodobacteraceae bacterium]